MHCDSSAWAELVNVLAKLGCAGVVVRSLNALLLGISNALLVAHLSRKQALARHCDRIAWWWIRAGTQPGARWSPV